MMFRLGFDSGSFPINCRVSLVIHHNIIKNKIDIFLIEVEILDEITDIITSPRNKVYLKSLSFAYIFYPTSRQ